MRESKLWALHLFAGGALIVLLGVHMAVQHYPTLLGWLGWPQTDVRGFAAVAARGASSAWAVLYVLLLGFAVYHGMYGLRRVLHEVWYSPGAGRAIDLLVVVAGLVVFVYGLVVVFQAMPVGGAS
ncbi:MAG TPA: hypothetical protein VIK90_02465 [Limnochordales bacterium]